MKTFSLIVLLSATIALVSSLPTSKSTCGYEACHPVDPKKLNIHLVPHSHDDVGWLKTVDQYYYGAKNYIQQAGVQHIISSVVEALLSDPKRRFIQVETAFFWQWWQDQSDSVQNATIELINSGRLEMTNGAWSMNDEAAAHYQSIIDQFTWGLRIINDTVGECGRPRIGWQIDPFGHSKEMASIFSQIGYDAVLFARIDYRDNAKRDSERNLEMIWQGSQDLGNASNIFTSVLFDFYTAPPYFCWDVLCNDQPVINDAESPDFNVDTLVEDFAQYAIRGAERFQTNNLLLTMGGDFTYQAAEMYFINMDRLIEGFKVYKPDINIIYSTPSCYVKAVNEMSKAKELKFNFKNDDFLPLASDSNSYWTGYYTSRPNSKRTERVGNNLLQAMKQLASFHQIASGSEYDKDLTMLKEVMGIMQHHDAITGTEKQHVSDDYARLMAVAMEKAQVNVNNIVTTLLGSTETVNEDLLNLTSCLLANVSYCEPAKNDKFMVAVYNPLSRTVNHHVRLPVNGNGYKITGPKGAVNYEILPGIHIFDYVENFTPEENELVFLADNVPPMGIQYYYIEKTTAKKVAKPANKSKKTRFGTEETGFEINETTGFLSSVTLNGITLNISQQFLYYNSANGSNFMPSDRASGAYIFRPAVTTPQAVPISTKATYTVHSTDLVDEVHQIFNEAFVRQIIRVHKTENYIEFDWLVGPLDFINLMGTEVVSRFTTTLASDETFYTDANGRQMVKRVRNFRETFNWTDEEPVAGNYYPVTSKISIKDVNANIELAVLNDRAQGGSSLKDGEIELMVHRRILYDDNFGVNEPLNEYEFGQGVVARGRHYLTFGAINSNPDGRSSAAQQRDLAMKKLLSPWMFIGTVKSEDVSFEDIQSKLKFEFAGLTRSLPQNVHILTLEPWTEEELLLLRLEHTLESNEDANLSQPVSVDLNNLFTLFDIVNMTEMNLAGNIPKSDVNRLQWYGYDDTKVKKKASTSKIDVKSPITLNPMEIKTFIVEIQAKKRQENVKVKKG